MKPSFMLVVSTILALMAALAGCAVGPDFRSPAAPGVDRYGVAPLPEKTVSADTAYGESQAFAIGKQLPSEWWTLLGSKRLDDLVTAAFANSPTVASAQAALRQAHQNYIAEHASLFPFFDIKASGERQKIDTATFGNPGGGALIYNLFNASVNVSYGLDLFGGTRRAVEQQAALEEYQKFELLGTYQTLAANVVVSGLDTAGYGLLVSYQQQVVNEEEDLLAVTEARYRLGAIAYADVLTARSNLATERAAIVPLQLQLDQAQNQVAVYIGKLPGEYVPQDFALSEFTLPQEIPLSIPSELVRQRPDIRAAEAQLHAASANVGVATANMLPQISLTASYGTQSSQIDKLFSGNIWSLSGDLTQPLLHAGELTAKRRAAIAAYDQAAADYRQTVLLAFKNVADALNVLRTDAETLQAQQQAFSTAREALHLTEQQYKLGGASYLSLLAAQMQYAKAQSAVIKAGSIRFVDTVTLFQALGGADWNVQGTTVAGAQ